MIVLPNGGAGATAASIAAAHNTLLQLFPPVLNITLEVRGLFVWKGVGRAMAFPPAMPHIMV